MDLSDRHPSVAAGRVRHRWPAWTAAAISGAGLIVYLVLIAFEPPPAGDRAVVLVVVALLLLATAAGVVGAVARSPRLAAASLGLASVVLLVFAFLTRLSLGPVFPAAAVFSIWALVNVVRARSMPAAD